MRGAANQRRTPLSTKELEEMKKAILALVAILATALAALGAAVVGSGPSAGTASSHREAPLIAEDPSADNTDLYAFRSPDRPNTVTIVSNWIPGEDPGGRPELLHVLAVARSTRSRIDRTGDARAGHRLRVPLRPDAPGLRSSATPSRAGRCGRTASSSRAARPRRTTSARARRRTTVSSPPRRS